MGTAVTVEAALEPSRRLGVGKVHVIDRCEEVAGRNGYLVDFWMCLRWKPEQGSEV